MITSFHLQYTNVDPIQVANAALDAFITEGAPNGAFPAITDTELGQIQAAGTEVYGYVNPLVTDSDRPSPFWEDSWTEDGDDLSAVQDDAPDFLKTGRTNSFGIIVDFQDPAWRALIVQQINILLSRGYDGIFFDDLTTYFLAGDVPGTQALATQTMTYLSGIMAEIRLTYPNAKFIVNGSPYIVTDAIGGAVSAASTAFLADIDAFLLENQFGADGLPPFTDAAVQQAVSQILPHVDVLAIETCVAPSQTLGYMTQATGLGIVPTAVDRADYSAFIAPVGAPPTTSDDLIDGLDCNNGLVGLAGDDTIRGFDGEDRIEGGPGADTIDGGDGIDGAVYTNSSASVRVDLNAGTATGGDANGDILISIEWLSGSAFADVLTGNAQWNRIDGADGNDLIKGGSGPDFLIGGPGFDFVDYRDISQPLTFDLVNFAASSEVFREDFFNGVSIVGFDESMEGIFGSASHANTFIGDENRTFFTGGSQGDTISGNGGSDILRGRAGNDTIDGGDGSDALLGNAGNDTLTGGADRDIFWFGLGTDDDDLITDFMVGADLIGFQGSAVNGVGDLTIGATAGGDALLSWAGGSIELDGVTAAEMQASGNYFFA